MYDYIFFVNFTNFNYTIHSYPYGYYLARNRGAQIMANYINDIADFKSPTKHPTKTELEIMKEKYMKLNNKNRGLIVRYAWTF